MNRILFVINAFEIDAPNKMMFWIANHLAHDPNYRVAICALRPVRIGTDVRTINVLNPAVELVCLADEKSLGLLQTLKSLKNYIRNFKPDIVHATLTRPCALCALIKSRGDMPPSLIWTENGTHEWGESRWLPRWLVRSGIRYLAKYTDKIVAVSQGLCEVLRNEKLPTEKLMFINNSVDLGKFIPICKEQRLAQRTKLGVDTFHFVIGAAGNLRHVKGYDLLLQSLAVLRRSVPDLCLILWGRGPEEDNLKSLANELNLTDNVIFAGHNDSLHESLGCLDLFVQPSRSEAFGLACAEAISCGVSIVVNDVPGLRDLVTQPEIGMTANATNPTEFAEAIYAALMTTTSPETLRSYAQQHFAPQRMVAQYAALYQSLIADMDNE